MPYILNRLDGARMRIPIDVATKTFQLAERTVLVLLQHDNAGFSAPVVFRYKAQGAGNGLSPCQALQRRSGAPQERPKGWPVRVNGCVAPLSKGLRPLVARPALP